MYGKCKHSASLNSVLSYASQLSEAKLYFLIVLILHSLVYHKWWAMGRRLPPVLSHIPHPQLSTFTREEVADGCWMVLGYCFICI